MSLESCIRSAKQWVKENSDVELNAKELEQVGQFMQHAEELGATAAQKAEIMQRVIDAKLAADQLKARAKNYLNTINVAKSIDRMTANSSAWIEGGQHSLKAPVDAFMAELRGGSYRPGQGTNLDPGYYTDSARTDYLRFARNALTPQDAKILQALDIKNPLSRDIYLEKSAIENKTQLGQTNNDTALRMAKSIHAIQNYTLSDVKAVNPYVMDAKNFLVSRVHDRDLIAAAGRDQWVKDAMNSFGSSFLGMTPAEKLATFNGIYKDITSGQYGGTNEFNLDDLWKSKGTAGNQAARSAGSRTLTATDAMAEYTYASKYGTDLWKNILGQIDSQARDVGRFTKGGPSPAENFVAKYNGILKTLEPDQKEAFQQAWPKFKEAFEVTMGRQDNVAHGLLARTVQNGLSWQSAVSMGLHVPRSLNGVQAAVTLARDAFGKTLPENVFEVSTNITKGLLQMDGGRESLQAMGGSLRSVSRDMMGVLRPDASKPGFAAQASEMVGKLSLTDRWVASQKFGLVNLMTDELGARAPVKFEALPGQTQRLLGRYNLSDAWQKGVLQQAVITDGPLKGKITPESIRSLTDEQIAPLKENQSAREGMRVRTEMALNYGVLLNDSAGMAVGESNSRSRIFAYGATDINDGWGMARRTLMQFHQAAIIHNQLALRTARSGGGAMSSISGVLQYALGSAFLGMVGEGIVHLSQGKQLPAPDSPQMLTHAASGTGLLGVYGDILANSLLQPQASTVQRVMDSDILGPAVGTVGKALTAGLATGHGALQALQGVDKPGQYGGKYWANLVHGLTPGQNLFYTKAAVDYMLMNEMHEFMGGGGYLETLRRQTSKTSAWPESMGGEGGQQQYTFGGKNFWE